MNGYIEISEKYFKKLMDLLEEYKKELYRYNREISLTGYYLKPYHMVVKKSSRGKIKYIYYGRYWYKILYLGKRGKTSVIKWIYLGNEKPSENLPDPPRHPLEGIVIKIENNRVFIKNSNDFVLNLLG